MAAGWRRKNVKEHLQHHLHHDVEDRDHDPDPDPDVEGRPGRGEDRVVAQLVARTPRHWQGVRSVGYNADDNDDDD